MTTLHAKGSDVEARMAASIAAGRRMIADARGRS